MPKGTPVRGADKARTGKEAPSRKQQASLSYTTRQNKAVPKWNVTEYKPPRKISDKELEAARRMFFDLDRDGSGSIDAEELGMMLRSLGQNPTEEELVALIESVDDGDKDGQIQLREFLKLYTQSLDGKNSGQAGKEDIDNVYCAFGGDPSNPNSLVDKKEMAAKLQEFYDLDIDADMLGKGDQLTKADIESILVTAPKPAQ